MKVLNDYNKCLTNYACSIRKYFGLEYKHNTIKEVDDLLEKYKPRNVITFLFDGMGTYVLNRTDAEFFKENKLMDLHSVFPATTVACTTSVRTGLNPVETNMLGWNMYYDELDRVITTFLHSYKDDPDDKLVEEARDYNLKYMKTKGICDELGDKGIEILGFKGGFSNPNEMVEKVISNCKKDGMHYMYVYDTEPDGTMHVMGCDGNDAKSLIMERNNAIMNFYNRMDDDTIAFVIADHGHTNIENIELSEYPDIIDCLREDTSIEPRACNFMIKSDKKELFVELFNKYFGNYYDLYTKEDVINSKLFGDGEENIKFRSSLGDYLAIAKTNKTIIYGNHPFKSHHAGYTIDEYTVPLILVKKR